MSSNMRLTRICGHCSKEFVARTTVTRFCGDICAKKAYKERKRTEKITASKSNQSVDVIGIVKQKEFLTVSDLALLLSCSKRTAYRMIEQGNLKAVNLSERKTLIKRSEVDKLFV